MNFQDAAVHKMKVIAAVSCKNFEFENEQKFKVTV